MAILRLGYVYKMLHAIHGHQASMLNAENFKMKLIKLENKKVKDQYSITQSMFATQSKSQVICKDKSSNLDNDNVALRQAQKER